MSTGGGLKPTGCCAHLGAGMGRDSFWRSSRAMLCLLRQALGVSLILGSMARCLSSARVPNGLRLCGNVHTGASLHPPRAQAELSILEPAEEAGGGWVLPAPFQEVAPPCSSPAVVCRTPPGLISGASTPGMLVTWHISIGRVRLCHGGSRNRLRRPISTAWEGFPEPAAPGSLLWGRF